MADLKTSQEISGTTLASSDEIRIARSGSNYKLTGSQMFSQVIDYGDLQTLMAAGELIAGRKYKVTGLSWIPLIVEAISGNAISEVVLPIEDTWNDFNGIGIYDFPTDAMNLHISKAGNISIGNTTLGAALGTNTRYNIFQLSVINNSNNRILNHSFISSSTITIDDGSIENSQILASIITTDSNLSNSIGNCFIKDVTINLINGAQLTNCTIIGQSQTKTVYTFDGVTLDGETIIAGVESTATYAVRSGVEYDPTSYILTLPANTEWVGKFLLQDFNASDILQFIDAYTYSSMNNHTPVIFQNDSGVVIQTLHINNPASSSGLGELMFPIHHGSADDLHTNYSYLKAKFDIVNNLWAVTEMIDYV